jgi:hypothetical protein
MSCNAIAMVAGGERDARGVRGADMKTKMILGRAPLLRVRSALLLALSLALPLAACGGDDDDDDDDVSVGLACGDTKCSASQYCLTRTGAGGASVDTCEARPSGCASCDCIQPDNCSSKSCASLGSDISVQCSM